MADWNYISTDRMIKGADVIAVVDIGDVQDTNAPFTGIPSESASEC